LEGAIALLKNTLANCLTIPIHCTILGDKKRTQTAK